MQPKPPNRLIALLLAFTSGIAALIEELAFFNMLEIGLGATHITLAAITTAFLGGLALGSFLGGRFADRIKRPLFFYGLIEIVIGVSVFVVALVLPFFVSLVYSIVPNYPDHIGLAAVVKFIAAVMVLLVPTTCMGATLPVLVRAIVRRDSVQGGGFAAVYAVNTLGAVLGPVLAAFFFIPSAGVFMTLVIAACVNVLAGLAALAAGRSATVPDAWLAAGAQAPEPAQENAPGSALVIASVLAAVSGAAALIFEITWTKIFALVIGSTVYSFAIVLSAMLAGIGIGSAVAAAVMKKIKDGIFAFALITAFLAGSALAVAPFGGQKFFEWVVEIVMETGGVFGAIATVEFVVLFLVMLLPTACMGAALPVLVHAASGPLGALGRRVGIIYAANTLGAIAGSLLAGAVLIPAVGLQMTLVSAVVIAIALVAAIGMARLFREGLAKGSALLALAVLLISGAIFTPSWDRALLVSAPYVNAHNYIEIVEVDNGKEIRVKKPEEIRKYAGEILYYEEGAEGVVSVHTDPFGYRQLRINGKVDASTHYDVKTQLLAGYLPVFLRPEAKTALCVGLGAGITLDALVRGGVAEVDAVEISPEVYSALKYFGCVNHNVAESPAVKYYIDDARSFVRGTPRKYDIIVSVPSNPWIAGVSHLFTREFFSDVKSKLAEGGVFVQWLQMYTGITEDEFYRTARTFADGFENVQLWEARLGADYLLVGSAKPLEIDVENLLRLFSDDESSVSRDFRQVNIRTVPPVLASFLMDKDTILRSTPAGGKDSPITDDRNALAYLGPRSLHGSSRVAIFEPLLKSRRTGSGILYEEAGLPKFLRKDIRACGEARKKTAQAKFDFFVREEGNREYGSPIELLTEALDRYVLDDEALHLFFERHKLPQAREAFFTENRPIEAGWILVADVLAYVPGNLEAKWLLEMAKRKMGKRIEEVKTKTAAVLALPPEERDLDNYWHFYRLAQAYYILGDYAAARKELLIAESIDPDQRKVKVLEQMVQQKLGAGE
ncbi:MAG: fused MFS/spermidine synthase [Planctomycetota bacterium]|jgi:spermidine synthase